MTELRVASALSQRELAEVTGLIRRVTEVDGLSPISEHALLHLHRGADVRSTHLLAYEAETLVGYAHLDVTDEVAGSSAEIAVAPEYRRTGIGRLLVQTLLAQRPDQRLRLWAHGEHAAAGQLAAAMGFRRSRVLWQMRRSLLAPLPAVVLPPGIQIAPFRPGVDEEAWLTLNALAFASHPEQGSWRPEDLTVRMAEPWFNPAGFLMAWSGDTLAGFHWTKVHGGESAHEDIGEVYVVAIDPKWRGTGLGRALTVAGLRHLRSQGLRQAMLYVDAENLAAIRLYESLGFARWDTDVMYARQPEG